MKRTAAQARQRGFRFGVIAGAGVLLILEAALILCGVAMAQIGWSNQAPRFELTTGFTKHKLAPEGAWHYEGFETDTKLFVGSYQAGLLWLPIKHGDWGYGFRIGYADLGKIRASNSFPIYEDYSNADARVNPVCNRSTLEGCVGKFDGEGKTRGWYIGPAVERDFGGGVGIGLEVGAYIYHSNWTVGNLRVVDGDEFVPAVWEGFKWDSAKGQHITSYVGANVRWQNLFIAGRYYSQVHAARTDLNPAYIGMTSGPVWSLMAGISVSF